MLFAFASRRSLTPFGIACVAFAVVAAATGCEPDANAKCSLPELSSPRSGVISIPERSAFAPDVHRDDRGTLVAFVPSVIFGDGAVYRATSDDGLVWSDPVRVLDQEHSFGDFGVFEASVFRHTNGQHVALYTTTRNEAPFYVFGVATSEDGESFAKSHVGFFGSDTPAQDGSSLDGQEIHNPKVWFDGETYHLYYSGYAGRVINGDEGYTVASIGHAVSTDGLNFTFDSWVFESTACSDDEVATSMDMVMFGRSACACDSAGVVIVADGNRCGTDRTSFLLESSDGRTFSAPVALAERPGAGTVLLDGTNDAVAYVGDYGDLSTVAAVPLALDLREATACR